MGIVYPAEYGYRKKEEDFQSGARSSEMSLYMKSRAVYHIVRKWLSNISHLCVYIVQLNLSEMLKNQILLTLIQ